MKLMRYRSLPLFLFITLLLAASGCGGGAGRGADASSPSGTVSPPASEPAASTSLPASEPSASTMPPPAETSSALPVPSDPPAASENPDTESGKTGAVTALRLADPLTGWAGGDSWLARTDDGGKHWTIQLRHQYVVRQIFALDETRAWATLDIGDKRGLKLMRTTDGGKHWEDAGETTNDSFLHFISDNEAYSGNARTTDGGKTWKALPVPGKTVGDAYFRDQDNGWAVTNEPGGFAIRRTTDGGKTWPAVLSRKSAVPPTHAIIRSTGKNDAWVELIGGSGMSQTSYSLFHTADGGQSWLPVVAHAGAGSGPAPGIDPDGDPVPENAGSSPGALYVANPKTAFMGGQCHACDVPNTMGKTTDGGKTWTNLKAEFPGYGEQHIAAADADHVWWITTDAQEPSRMYVTEDGGVNWTLVHTFDVPE